MNKRFSKMLIMLVYVIISSIIVLLLKMPYLYSIIFVLIPPSIINFLWLKNSRKKILIFSFSATLLFGLAIELMSRLKDSWDVQSTLPRLLGIIPLENMLFAFINFFWVLSFYEYFIDKDKTRAISKKFKYLILGFTIFSSIIFSIYFHSPAIVGVNYMTLGMTILAIPSIIIFYLNPKLLKKTIMPVIFFSIVFFIYEIASLLVGNWWWPGEYIFPIKLFGHIFPIDDVIIWYILSTITLIGGYEFFADDFK